ncbi:transmembrane protein, putative [Medicago truncatula]|uniref:Transmembrane protein, putative n=1 Tax=Medicago truncatula TaxID=3880 RepID=A0A072UZA4_MEDTR|nr:transmembrane protein, putative [Medicago truncatula]
MALPSTILFQSNLMVKDFHVIDRDEDINTYFDYGSSAFMLGENYFGYVLGYATGVATVLGSSLSGYLTSTVKKYPHKCLVYQESKNSGGKRKEKLLVLGSPIAGSSETTRILSLNGIPTQNLLIF